MPLSPALKDAVNSVQSHAQQLRAVLTLTDELTRLGGLEQVAAEAEGGKLKAEQARAAADALLGETNRAIELADVDLRKAQARVVEASADAKRIITEARAEAKKLTDDAKAVADTILATAKADATKRAADIADEAQGRLDALNAVIDTAMVKQAQIEADTTDLVKRADDAKAYLSKLAGG